MTITQPGNKPASNVVVRSLLKAPTVIQGRVIDPNVQFLSDFLYRGPIATPSGVVEFQVAKLDDTYASRGDSKVIEPGAQFPTLDVAEGPATNGSTDKFGAEYIVTYEAVDRNDINPMLKGNRKLRNHIVRQDATRALAAIEAAVAEHSQVTPASATWGTEGAAWEDLGSALASAPTGYDYDTLLINKQDAWLMARAADIKKAYQPTNRADAQIYGSVFSPLNGFLGLDVVINDFVPRGRTYLVQRNVAGFVALEKDFNVRIVDEPKTERYVVMGSKRSAPFVDEPAAVQVITGISA